MFPCGPYKSGLDTMLSESQMPFLAPAPCCSIPAQPQKILHRVQWSKAPPGVPHHTSIRLAVPLREHLENLVSQPTARAFSVRFLLPTGRKRGQWGLAPCICSPPPPCSLLRCTLLPQHELASSFRKLHPLCLLG